MHSKGPSDNNKQLSASLEISNLSVGFTTRNAQIIKALDALTFNLTPGKTTILVGESGCGKSLTAEAIMRLLPQNMHYSDESQIQLAGIELLNIKEAMMRQIRGKRLAMIFQEPMTSLNPVMTIGKQIDEAIPKHLFSSKASRQERIIELLREVEIQNPETKMHHYPHQLSGGQKQRVVIAIALAANPDVLIADEPTTSLDVTVQAQILSLLKKLQHTHKMSLLLITHDLGLVKAMGDTICVLYAGQIVVQSTVTDFFTTTHHPYVQQLLRALPTFEARNKQLSIIKGHVPSLDELPSGCRFHPRCAYAFARCHQEEPQLQHVDNQWLRCHLYPEHEKLPVIEQTLVESAIKARDVRKQLLEVNNLSIHFVQKKSLWPKKRILFKAVDGLSFSLNTGRTLAIVGESGCGKTSTARAILRLNPVTDGLISFQGNDVCSLKRQSLKAYRRKVQIIFQDPYSSMNPRMTVSEIISEGMRASNVNKSVIQHRVIELLNKVNLPKTSLERYPHQFSGGQRQRICIARALACNPDLLILDEPTSALDVSVQAQILNLLKELQHESNVAYLFITHNMSVVSYMADEVLVMKDGQKIEFGSCEQVLKNPKQEYTKELLRAVF